jgi:hypothetical protein
VSLSEPERAAISVAGQTGDQTLRGRAVAVVLSKEGPDREESRRLLAASYLDATSPSFHLIPRGEAMLPVDRFDDAYKELARATSDFSDVTADSLVEVLSRFPAALAPLRMIAGLTYNELSVAVRLATDELVSGGALRTYEREQAPPAEDSPGWARRAKIVRRVAETLIAVIDRRILQVPPAVGASFHSKLDKRDTVEGWTSVARDAREGVPYAALLYQRYVGGLWRQVQDAYSEVKGDAILELPLEALLSDNGVPFYRSPSGASGARLTAQRYGIDPGPDFLIPEENPAVIIESKVGEDGGTVRDKAARIQRLAGMAAQRGLILCAAVDGKGWSERPTALADVVVATNGRTFSLATLPHLLEVPEIAAWRGQAT